MVILLIVIIALVLAPAIIIWTNRANKLRMKIVLSVLSAGIAVAFLSACIQISDKQDVTDYAVEM